MLHLLIIYHKLNLQFFFLFKIYPLFSQSSISLEQYQLQTNQNQHNQYGDQAYIQPTYDGAIIIRFQNGKVVPIYPDTDGRLF